MENIDQKHTMDSPSFKKILLHITMFLEYGIQILIFKGILSLNGLDL